MESYDFNGVPVRKSDSDTSKYWRKIRYQQYLGLKSLPFRSKEQQKRYTELKALRVRDNKVAFLEDVPNSPITRPL